MFKNLSFCFAFVVLGSTVVHANQEPAQFRILRQQQKDPQVYFSLQRPVVKEVVGRNLTVTPQLGSLFQFQVKPQITTPGLAIASDIINVGMKLWSIVEAGKPVSSFDAQYAHALPRGVEWTSMSNWQEPMVRTYHVQYKNLYGMTVVDFTYSVVANTGGQYNNRGAYIANATVIANELSVMWGFDFKANAEIPVVMNMATEEAPVAGMQVKVGWEVDSVISSEKSTELYFINGLGEMNSVLESQESQP